MTRRNCHRSTCLIAILIFLLSLTSCATLSLRPFNPRHHGSVYAEWPPHRNAGEWWYVTGVLENKAGDLWLYQFTIFHQAKNLGQGYLLDLALSDYRTGQHIFEEYATTDSRKAYAHDGPIIFGKNSITLSHRGVSLIAQGARLSFSLKMTPEKPPVWEADNGVVGMGRPHQLDQMSYYYSFTRLRTSGTISYEKQDGTWVKRHLTGSSWLDRQWGHFSSSGWDWFSIRLFDGTDVMLYAFPSTGYREGTVENARGAAMSFTDFSYHTLKWQRHDRSRYGLEWSVRLPPLERRLNIVALAKNNFDPNRVLTYWEGLCKVYNTKGRLVGYAVEETTASAHRADP